MDHARLLADIISQNAPVAAAPLQSLVAYQKLIDDGYIEETGVVQSILCDDCNQPHDAALVFETDQYGIHCHELGFIVKERRELVAVKPNLKRLVESLADSMGCKRKKSTPIHNETWRIGVVSGPSADVAMYFQPTMRDFADLRSLETALAREARLHFGVVLTAEGEMTRPPFKTLCIEDCLMFNEETGVFAFDVDLLTVVGAPETRKGGRPSPYRITLAKIIADRRNSGAAISGTNAEARAIQDIFNSSNQNDLRPSLSTIKRVIAEI